MNPFYSRIRIAHKQQELDPFKVHSFTCNFDRMKTAVFYEDGEGSHDFYLRKSNSSLIMDSPAGPAYQVLSVVERIARFEGARLVIDSGDVPKEFKEALIDLGYQLKGNYYRKSEEQGVKN